MDIDKTKIGTLVLLTNNARRWYPVLAAQAPTREPLRIVDVRGTTAFLVIARTGEPFHGGSGSIDPAKGWAGQYLKPLETVVSLWELHLHQEQAIFAKQEGEDAKYKQQPQVARPVKVQERVLGTSDCCGNPWNRR